MPGGFPVDGALCNPATLTFTSLTASASANTKGTWSQLVAATSYDASFIVIHSPGGYNSGNFAEFAIDIGIGASGSEIVIISNLILDIGTASGSTIGLLGEIVVPVCIPKGSRVAARVQSSVGSYACYVFVTLYDASFSLATHATVVDSIGFVSASTHGTSLTAPGSVNTKGAWTQLVASTSYDYAGFFGAVDSLAATGGASYAIRVDVGVGGAGSENVLMADFYAGGYSTGGRNFNPSIMPLLMTPVPAGSRLSARYQYSNASGNVGLTLYGLRK